MVSGLETKLKISTNDFKEQTYYYQEASVILFHKKSACYILALSKVEINKINNKQNHFKY